MNDDQIIYGWNGASYKRIQSFLFAFSAELIQLPTNYRCPPAIVEAANRLVVYNTQRTSAKKPLIAGKTEVKYPAKEHIQLRVFGTGEEEALGVAQEITQRGRSIWGQTTVLARTRALLGVPAATAPKFTLRTPVFGLLGVKNRSQPAKTREHCVKYTREIRIDRKFCSCRAVFHAVNGLSIEGVGPVWRNY